MSKHILTKCSYEKCNYVKANGAWTPMQPDHLKAVLGTDTYKISHGLCPDHIKEFEESDTVPDISDSQTLNILLGELETTLRVLASDKEYANSPKFVELLTRYGGLKAVIEKREIIPNPNQ